MNNLFFPLITLLAWTSVMWAWMLITRVPAIFKMRLRMDPAQPRGEQMSLLPPEVRWKADNYNNLMEQPTVFYALVIALILMNDTSQASFVLAWGYVGLRIMHSLIQALINNINFRFAVFVMSGLVLIGLIVRAFQKMF